MWVAARALGDADEAVVRDVAYASGLANWFRAIPELEAQKRVPLVDGRAEAVALLAQGALARLEAAHRARGKVSKGAGQALFAGWQAEAILKQVADEPQRVAEGALGQSDFAKKAGLLRRSLTGRW